MTYMQIEERRVGDVTVLRLRGRLVLEEGEAPLRKHIDALIAEGRTEIVLNMHDVYYIDSSGVGSIAAKFLSVRRRGGDLKLVDLSERCYHVFDITGLLPILMPVRTEAEALRSFAVKA
jgi:anti-sigma B factor antagonist